MSLPMTARRIGTKHSAAFRSEVMAGCNSARIFFSLGKGEDEAFRYIHLLEQKVPTPFKDKSRPQSRAVASIKLLTWSTVSQLQRAVVIVHFHLFEL